METTTKNKSIDSNQYENEPVMKWEYRVIKLDIKRRFWTSQYDIKMIENKLNELGQQGWELVTMSDLDNRYSTSPVITIKRAK